MNRRSAIVLAGLAALAACTATPAVQIGADGKPLPQVYPIPAANQNAIPFRLLDAVNSLRSAAGVTPMQLNAQLNAAAATHSRDMSLQNRPWHFGSDASSPLTRVQRTGYQGALVGELIALVGVAIQSFDGVFTKGAALRKKTQKSFRPHSRRG